MTNPAVIIVTGVVIAVAAVIAIFASNEPQKMWYGRGGHGNGTTYVPPSPPQSPVRRRRRSHDRTCQKCQGSQFIKVSPCNHQSLCKECFETHLKNDDTCPICCGRIDSCSPPIPPFGNCINCRRFTKLFKFLPCNHSPRLCISCFEEKNKSYSECPECKGRIQGSEQSLSTRGPCNACHIFTRLAVFKPCNHAAYCRRDVLEYLQRSGQECSECGEIVTNVI